MQECTMKKSILSSFNHCIAAAACCFPALCFAQLIPDWVGQCALIASPQDRLACFDAMSKNEKEAAEVVRTKKGLPVPSWDTDTKSKLAKAVDKDEKQSAKAKLDKEKAAKAQWFLRATTDMSDINKEGAKISMTRSQDRAIGVGKAALIYVEKEGIGSFLKLNPNNQEKLYVGLGFHRDDTDLAKKVATNDFRLGYRRAFQIREKDSSGLEQYAWFSLGKINDHVADTSKSQIDMGWNGSKRWYDDDEDKRVLFDRKIALQINPFSDRIFKDPAGLKPRTSGVGIELKYDWYQPTHVDWLTDETKRTLPDWVTFSSLRNVGTAGTKQYSTMNTLKFKWDLAFSADKSMQPSISLYREVGSNFRKAIASSAKTMLTLDVKYN
jgi:hypothetical protein